MKMLPRGDNRLEPYFEGRMDPKEGWSIEQCTNEDLVRVLEFLTPICHPEKPKKVVVRLGSTMVASLFEQGPVDWASILHEALQRQVVNIRGSKQGTIFAYLFHLYNDNALLMKEEQKVLKTNTNYVMYGVKAPGAADDAEDNSDEPVPLTRSNKRRLVLGSGQPVSSTVETVDLTEESVEVSEPVGRADPVQSPGAGPSRTRQRVPPPTKWRNLMTKDTWSEVSLVYDNLSAIEQ